MSAEQLHIFHGNIDRRKPRVSDKNVLSLLSEWAEGSDMH